MMWAPAVVAQQVRFDVSLLVDAMLRVALVSMWVTVLPLSFCYPCCPDTL